MTPLAMASRTKPMRTHMASMPVALETAPQTPPRTRLSGLRRRVRSLLPTLVMVVVAPVGPGPWPCR